MTDGTALTPLPIAQARVLGKHAAARQASADASGGESGADAASSSDSDVDEGAWQDFLGQLTRAS
eukprot:CAMPEP_0181225326 /NCGR_PEP_ID=MMETSP1096-20121128/31621_1 /TAXON_ID=156174 ORGANISM="Chrysochromulina ericina, Strain CCMP281" /NCGR_SAMPLE_ID=MMETSP1096 /ASSEMBLY_ACC=CAM_ASM_000453 /LENGTH=64 /DNA_ID=CAMNT_0023318509 /DNA_START=148 /DNA_END=342 /DNA_ORIENTATION=-